MRKRVDRSVLIGLLVVVAVLFSGRLWAHAGAVATRPNVIVVMADDLSAKDLGCYGHPTNATPHLDRLIGTGVKFRTCWATPICSPTRAQIMTGRYGFRTQWFHNDMKVNEPLCAKHLTLGQVFQKAGYATAIAGKWQLPGKFAQYGFDEHCMWKNLKDGGFDGPVEQKGHSLPGRPARYWHPAIVRNGEQAGDRARRLRPRPSR